AAAPAGAVPGDAGPAVVPLTDTSRLLSSPAEWDTKNQHRVWWNASAPGGGRWDAVLPAAAQPVGPASQASEWWVVKGIASPTLSDYAVMVDNNRNRR